MGAQLSKAGGGEGVCYVHLPVVRLGHFRAKLFCYWLCLLSSLSSLECFVLTWHPAGDVPVTCLHGGFSPSQGGGQISPGQWDILRVISRHVFANTVRYICLDLQNQGYRNLSYIPSE